MTSLSSTALPSSPALLMGGVDTVSQVIVHPMVLLHVLDHHTRRQEVSGRVIGTLLGRRDGKTVCPILPLAQYFCCCLLLLIYFFCDFRLKLPIALLSLTPNEATKLPLEKTSTSKCLHCISDQTVRKVL